MKKTKRKSFALMVRKILEIVRGSLLLFLALISLIYTECNRSKRFKEYSKNFIPALVTWATIGIIFLVAFFSITSAMDEKSKTSGLSTESRYEVDYSALDAATKKYEEEQSKKSEKRDEHLSSNLEDSHIDSKIDDSKIEEKKDVEVNPYFSEAEICMLVQAVQHETKIFESYSNYDMIQQYMAASIVNRIGEDGFGTDYSTAYTVYDLLANSSQYDNIIEELDYFDAYDYTTRQNVYKVLNGSADTPEYLYYERCSEIGEDFYTAQNNFYAEYPECTEMQIVYMELSSEGRYIIFGTNPYGAYACSY